MYRRLGRRPDAAGGAAPASGDARRHPAHHVAVLQLQRSAGNAGVTKLLADGGHRQRIGEVLASGEGRPLDDAVRAVMEARLGHDFSSVRVHTGPRSTQSARALGAHAYTVGDDIVFEADRYSPGTAAGRRVLAHELAHVVQQRAGPVAGTPTGEGVNVSDPGDAFEVAAEKVADLVTSSDTGADAPDGGVRPPPP